MDKVLMSGLQYKQIENLSTEITLHTSQIYCENIYKYISICGGRKPIQLVTYRGK